MMAYSAVHGCAMPCFLSEKMFDILTSETTDGRVDIDDVCDDNLQQQLNTVILQQYILFVSVSYCAADVLR